MGALEKECGEGGGGRVTLRKPEPHKMVGKNEIAKNAHPQVYAPGRVPPPQGIPSGSPLEKAERPCYIEAWIFVYFCIFSHIIIYL